MMFYKPQTDEPRPLLVALHAWSEGYRQSESVIYAEWCVANGWVFVHPYFRGANTRPQATGSELVLGDVLSAIDDAKEYARVDERRIYAVAWSGGGLLGVLPAGADSVQINTLLWVPLPFGIPGQFFPKAGRKEDIAILVPLALGDAHLSGLQIP